MTNELTLSDGDLEATVLPELGMVVSSLRHRGEELLAQLGGPEAYAEHAATFAIPLLHPFANRLRAWEYDLGGHHVVLQRDDPVVHMDRPTGLPIHGVVAASPFWTVLSSSGDSVTAELDFAAHPDYMATFPYPHRVRFEALLRRPSLAISLTVIPTGDEPVPISFGFHPYLTLPGTDRREWAIEMPVAGDSLSGPLGERIFDDPFNELVGERPIFALADDRRRIEVEFRSNYPVAQVYTPEDAQFICFEPMTAPVDALRTGRGLRFAEPGGEFAAEFAVNVS
jgi:galactose mutarotase-like enzyme